MECRFCHKKTNENDAFPNVCRRCFDEANFENPSAEWKEYKSIYSESLRTQFIQTKLFMWKPLRINQPSSSTLNYMNKPLI